MPSEFSWVDLDEDTQRNMLEIAARFKSQDTIDELGLGKIRGAFSDYFFPGTSTIQTRARYFLFIPWLYRSLKKRDADRIPYLIDKRERELIHALVKGNPKGEKGIIGAEAQDTLQRLPSSIYWRGLFIWGIRHSNASQSSFERQLKVFLTEPTRKQECDEEDEPIADDIKHMWASGLPDAPKGFPNEKESIGLEKEEAEFLRDRLRNEHPNALITLLIDAPKFDESSDDLWENCSGLKKIPELDTALVDSKNIFDLMYGASIAYNLMLARKLEASELKKEYAGALSKWHEQILAEKARYKSWRDSMQKFWESQPFFGSTVDPATKVFIETWIALALKGKSSRELIAEAEPIILGRERRIKGGRARAHNAEYLKLWRGDSGTGKLNYRWGIASRLIADIRKGLGYAK